MAFGVRCSYSGRKGGTRASELNDLDARRVRREPSQVAPIVGQDRIAAAVGARDHRSIGDVGDLGFAAEFAGGLGQCLVERLEEAGVHDLREPGLPRTAPGLGKRACWDDRDDAAGDGFAPERPEAPVVAFGGDQRARSERQSRQRALTRARSFSLIAPCSASHSSSRRRAASSFSRYSTASATNADRLRPVASAASRVRCANSGSKESDNFSTGTKSNPTTVGLSRSGACTARAFSLLSSMIRIKAPHTSFGTLHEFVGREVEALPFPDESFDVVISNGVIDLVPDKDAVYSEIYRVLVAGGRVQIADVTIQEPVSAEGRRNIDLWTG